MQETTSPRGNAIIYLKWSIIATSIVTVLFVLVDIFINHALQSVLNGDLNFNQVCIGLVAFMKILFSNFVPALVTSILTLLIGCIITRDGESIGVKYEYTHYFLLALVAYIVIYFIYLNNCKSLVAGLVLFVITFLLVFMLLKFWVDKIVINNADGECKNTTN